MSLVSKLFGGNKPTPPPKELLVDVHSHLLPGIDDGARDMEDTLEMIQKFQELGYRRLITTPHILQDYYPNTPDIIKGKLGLVNKVLESENIEMKLEAAAEYYLDEFLLEKIRNKEEILTFGDNYVLFEMSFMSESPFLKEFIFLLKSSGFNPILAHVERYSYYFKNIEDIHDLIERGCLLQVNINSLAGYYGKSSLQLANQLIEEQTVHLLGSDCHNSQHLEVLSRARTTKSYAKAVNLPLINFTLGI